MKTCPTTLPICTSANGKFQKRSDFILHRIQNSDIATSQITKKSTQSAQKYPPLPTSVNLDSLQTIDDCYAKLVEIVPKAQDKMEKSDLIGCVIDYITQLEDELLQVRFHSIF